MIVALVWLPSNPPRPAPAIMTEEDVCCMLSINPRTLRQYHDDGKCRGFRCGRSTRWKLVDVLAFADSQKEMLK
jgi:predicted site-specific integrase-resolvase